MTATESINAQDVYRFMNEHGIVVSFVGELTHEVVSSLLTNIEKSIGSLEADSAVKQQVYGVTMQCLENITLHNLGNGSGNKLGGNPASIFIFSANDNHYKIITGNHVNKVRINELTQHIDKVNSLDKKVLKDLYLTTVKAQNKEVGLGIIDIAVKSGNKLVYEFKPVSEDVVFYILQAIINK